MFYSAEINGIHMLKQYNMPLESLHCVQPPAVKTNIIDIPGGNGSLDLTEYFGRVFYENREATMIFGTGNDRALWPSIYSEIMNHFHGKKVKIIFDDDPAYYWIGRASISNYEKMWTLGKITITASVEPYKYEVNSSYEDWLWDPLDFIYGIIREYQSIKVNGTLKYTVTGSAMPVILEIESDAAMQVIFGDQTYNIKKGINKIYGIEIVAGENVLTFKGTGTITIRYRGGSL